VGAGKLGRRKLGLGKLGSGKVGRWFCADAVNSVETWRDPNNNNNNNNTIFI